MGSAASTLPDAVTLELAKECVGEKFDVSKWEAIAVGEGGTATKEAFIKLISDSGGFPGGGVTREQAEADSKADT